MTFKGQRLAMELLREAIQNTSPHFALMAVGFAVSIAVVFITILITSTARREQNFKHREQIQRTEFENEREIRKFEREQPKLVNQTRHGVGGGHNETGF